MSKKHTEIDSKLINALNPPVGHHPIARPELYVDICPICREAVRKRDEEAARDMNRRLSDV